MISKGTTVRSKEINELFTDQHFTAAQQLKFETSWNFNNVAKL